MLMNWINEMFIIAFTFELPAPLPRGDNLKCSFSICREKRFVFNRQTVAGGAVLLCSADKFPVLLCEKNACTFCMNFSPYGHCYPACEIAGYFYWGLWTFIYVSEFRVRRGMSVRPASLLFTIDIWFYPLCSVIPQHNTISKIIEKLRKIRVESCLILNWSTAMQSSLRANQIIYQPGRVQLT